MNLPIILNRKKKIQAKVEEKNEDIEINEELQKNPFFKEALTKILNSSFKMVRDKNNSTTIKAFAFLRGLRIFTINVLDSNKISIKAHKVRLTTKGFSPTKMIEDSTYEQNGNQTKVIRKFMGEDSTNTHSDIFVNGLNIYSTHLRIKSDGIFANFEGYRSELYPNYIITRSTDHEQRIICAKMHISRHPYVPIEPTTNGIRPKNYFLDQQETFDSITAVKNDDIDALTKIEYKVKNK